MEGINNHLKFSKLKLRGHTVTGVNCNIITMTITYLTMTLLLGFHISNYNLTPSLWKTSNKEQVWYKSIVRVNLQRTRVDIVWPLYMPIFQQSSISWLRNHVRIRAWSPRAILGDTSPLAAAAKHTLGRKRGKRWQLC